ALGFALALAPNGSGEVYLAVPFARGRAAAELTERDGALQFARAVSNWEAKLSRVTIELPPAGRASGETLKTAAAHILIDRDGLALQPGPRRYTRSWIRDGATMAAALLRVGCTAEPCEFIRWYARFQRPDGFVPCCVDRTGPDWLVEHDSHGQLIFT